MVIFKDSKMNNDNNKSIPASKIKEIVDKYGERYNNRDKELKDLINENVEERYKIERGNLDNIIKDMFTELRQLIN